MSGFCHSGCLELSWVEKLKAMRLLYEEKNNNYWRSEIAANKGDTRRLWRTFQSVLGEVPTADTDDHTADEFAAFFSDKVEAVHTSTAATLLYDVPYRLTPTLAEWMEYSDQRRS